MSVPAKSWFAVMVAGFCLSVSAGVGDTLYGPQIAKGLAFVAGSLYGGGAVGFFIALRRERTP